VDFSCWSGLYLRQPNPAGKNPLHKLDNIGYNYLVPIETGSFTGGNMLSNHEAHATLPAKDMSRARKFYQDKLGLTPTSELPGGLMYKVKDSWFLLFPSSGASNGSFTQLGWETDNIEKEVADLKSKGVVFEEYNMPNFKTVGSIFTSPSNRSAWFKDSEGNLHGIVQFTNSR
jgi:catechol 2,3-dioxygenase-like lactoylglutathione lyase family enzyme